MPRRKEDLAAKWLTADPALKQAFDDGVTHGRNEARYQILEYLMEQFIMDQKIERHSPEYDMALKMIRQVGQKFRVYRRAVTKSGS